MPHKQVLFHSAAREKVLRGASLLADAGDVRPQVKVGS
jgi:chaperonin GroEL